MTTEESVVATGSMIIGSRMLNGLADSDAECATSLAPLRDLVDIMNVSH